MPAQALGIHAKIHALSGYLHAHGTHKFVQARIHLKKKIEEIKDICVVATYGKDGAESDSQHRGITSGPQKVLT